MPARYLTSSPLAPRAERRLGKIFLVFTATETFGFHLEPQHPGGADAPVLSRPPLPRSPGPAASQQLCLQEPLDASAMGSGFEPQLEPLLASPRGTGLWPSLPQPPPVFQAPCQHRGHFITHCSGAHAGIGILAGVSDSGTPKGGPTRRDLAADSCQARFHGGW